MAMHLPTATSSATTPTERASSLKRFAYAFVPQFFRTRYFHDPAPVSRVFPTSHLDGIRGLSCIIVTNRHYLLAFTYRVWRGHETNGSAYYLDLPLVRLFTFAQSLVTLFFVIGGYVNALGALKLMQAATPGSSEKLLNTMSSAIFRRVPRLYLPVFFTTFVAMLLAYSGMYDPVDTMQENRALFDGLRDHDIPRFKTFSTQIQFFFWEWGGIVHFFRPDYFWPKHNPHLWSLNVEFRSAIMLYIVLLIVARAKDVVRLVLLVVMALYCHFWDSWALFCFISGAAICQFDLMRQKTLAKQAVEEDLLSEKLPLTPESRTWLSPEPVLDGLRTFGILFSGWLITAPQIDPHSAWGFQTLSYWLIPASSTDPGRILCAFGAILLVLTLRTCKTTHFCRAFLLSPPVQYLGRISYSQYLIHGQCQHLFGWAIPVFIWRYFSPTSMFNYCGAIIIGMFISLVITLCIADVVNREVDKRCVQISRKLDDLFFPKED